ncbi:hypothetical protein [Anabaenopsis elenkinii]|uniref:Uncharacterized protein n=1 Tax=Anabaenopsis elenkinii CCIBt3563 TaxID=2779889 RepID=A0A7S6RC01_9CYAN|nr:hypothetical protein [Anabaenopsis elenkinii]QOV22098.1 hypothetical protein IM676_15565 [Anabaenopsis elenkinii CCIBt3563]
MDTKALNILNEINLNLRSISSYIEKISKQEIKLDSNKIYLIDYSTYDWLKGSEKEEIRQSLEEYNQQLCHHIISDDFVQYCRTIYLQIEILLNLYDQSQNSKFKKLKSIFVSLRVGKEKFNYYNDKEYNIITHIMDIRDIASHPDTNGKSIPERVEYKGKSIEVKLENLKNEVSKNDIKSIFNEFVNIARDKNPDIKHKGQYAYITMYELKPKYLIHDSIIEYINNQKDIFRYKLGDNFKAIACSPQPENKLKKFFEEKNYQDVRETLDWFVKEIGNLC